MIRENYNLPLRSQLAGIRPASNSDIFQLIQACDARTELHSVRDVVRVIANTGMHNTELAALRFADIDLEGKWIFVGRDRKATHAQRVLPLRPKTMGALMSLRAANPQSDLLLGRNPRQMFRNVIRNAKIICPDLPRDRPTMYSVRTNFVSRLISSGVPLTIMKYCMGFCGQSELLGHLSLAPEVKQEIVRRNLENFVPEV
jgi:integrase